MGYDCAGPQGRPYAVDQIVVNPGWTGNFANGNGISLIHLTSAVPGVAPANIFTRSLGSDKGLTSTLVGYGLSGDGTNCVSTTLDGICRDTSNVP